MVGNCFFKRNTAAAGELKRVPPKRAGVWEVTAYAVLPMLFVMAGSMPSLALTVMPFILPILYLSYRRFGAYFPLSCVAVYGGASLIINYDILTVVYFCALFFGTCGLIYSAQLKPYLLCATAAAVFAVSGALVGMGTVRLAEGKPLGQVAQEYVMSEYEDPMIGFLARYNYDNAKLPTSVDKLTRDDDGYDKAASEYYGDFINDELTYYAWYYCIHFGGVVAAVGYLLSTVINRATVGVFDDGVSPEERKFSVRAMGRVTRENTAVKDMRIPRAFLWTCLLPTFITTAVLEIVGGYEALSATLMHAFVTIPTAFCFFTLMAYFASLFRGKARIAAYIVLFVIATVMVISPMALFIGSIIGVCDVILNLRFWTEFIRGD